MPSGSKDFWDKVGVVLQPMGGLLTALAVTLVGVKRSQVLDRRQAADTNARLFSELMSRREEAESSLRKDMFVSIIQPFLQPKAGDLDTRVLNLELLAVNFHDSLNLKPLFLDLQRRLAATNHPERDAYLTRVNRVAREITAKQLFSLEGTDRASGVRFSSRISTRPDASESRSTMNRSTSKAGAAMSACVCSTSTAACNSYACVWR